MADGSWGRGVGSYVVEVVLVVVVRSTHSTIPTPATNATTVTSTVRPEEGAFQAELGVSVTGVPGAIVAVPSVSVDAAVDQVLAIELFDVKLR